jgi:hypothetical protein
LEILVANSTHRFIFSYPAGLFNLPTYSGKILIKGSNGETLSVPYAGLASDLRKEIETAQQKDYPKIWSGPEWPYPTLDERDS